jgi:PleD family two-component response regulator
VTISLGVFAFDKDSEMDTIDILRRADEALYVSKAKGRNCSTIWDPGIIDTLHGEPRQTMSSISP